MVFHESLNPERNFSLAIPLVFIAILGGTTGVVGLATVLSPDSSYAVSPQAQLASPVQTMTTPVATKSAPIGSDEDMCKAGHMYEVTIGSDASAKTEDVGTKVDCEAKDAQGKKINQSNEMCSKGKEGKGYGNLKYKLSSGTSRDTLCYPGEDPKTVGLAAAARDLGPSDARRNLIGAMANDPKQMADVANTLGTMRDDTSRQLESCYSGSGDCVGPLNYVQGERMKLSNTKDALEEIREYGIEPTIPPPKTPTPGDYQGENPGAIDAALKNSASYLGPTSPGLSQSDLLGTPLSELNGRYKYGDLAVSTDGKTYTVWEEGQRAASISKVGEGQTIGDVIAAKQYMSGPESPYEYGRDTFAARVEAQGEVAYSSAQVNSEQTDTSAFDKWSSELPGAAMKDPAYDFRSEALDPSVAEAVGNANGDWAKNLKDFNYETAGATPEPGSGELKVGEEVPLPRPVRDLSGSLDVDVSKLPQGVGRIGDGLLVTNDGKEIRITDVASGKTESYYVSETKGAKLADLVQDTQVINGPYAQEADNLRKEANSVAKTEPERAAALRREADQIDPRVPASGPGARAPVDPNGNRVGGAGTPDGSRTNNQNGGGSGFGSALSSMLQGLMKALGAPQPTPAAPSQPCSADPNIYAQQQQQYQQQLQQYNYQIQQQQYQQQMNQYYADRTGAPTPPVQPLPPQPSACTPSTGSQCREQPQQPAAASCTGGWRPVYNGSCVTSWNCPTTGDAPTATLSCEPDLADVGQTLAITYNCSSGVASSSAFKVTTQPGGSATTTVKAPPRGTNTATYTLACTDNGKTTGAQCSVKVNRPNIFLVTNPQTVAPGEISLISWLTTGMDSCIISSPDQADFTLRNSSNTSVTGAATTSPIASSTAMFQLDCITKGGMDKQATTSVSVAP